MARSELQDEPTAEQIGELYRFINESSAWQRQRAQDKLFLDFYFGENAIEASDTANRKRRRRINPERMALGEAARVVDRLVSFYPEPPQFGMQFVGEQGSHSETIGERTGRALNEGFDQLNTLGNTPWADGVWSQILLGRRCELLVPGHEYYWDFPWKAEGEGESDWAKRHASWKRKAPLPVVWFNLPAESTFPASLGTSDDQALSTERLTWLDLMDIFAEDELKGSGVPDERKQRLEEVTLGIYSNRQWLAYCILQDRAGSPQYQDRILRSIEHEMGRCAIRILPGMTTGRKEPGYYWKSVLSSARELLVSADRLATRAATAAKHDALPQLVEYRNAAQDQGEGAKGDIEEWQDGDPIVLDAGDLATGRAKESIGPIFQPQFGQHTRELLILTLDRIGRMTGATDALDGSGGTNQPAWSVNYKAEIARSINKPLTKAVAAAAIDIAETLGKAVQAFDEEIVLAKLDDSGNRRGDIKLVPADLARYQPVIAVEYKAQIPINQRADYNLAMSMMAMSIQQGVPANFQWIVENLMGVQNYWTDWYQPWLQMRFMLSDEVVKIQTQWIAGEFEADIAKDAGMSAEEFMRVAQTVPEPARSLMLAFAQQQMAQQQPGLALPASANGGGSGLLPATVGALRAGQPFQSQPPQNIAPEQAV